MVDEHAFRALNVWIPLVDVDAASGAVEVVPEPVASPWPVRSLTLPSPCLAFGGEVEDHLVPVPLAAGDALFYRHDLFHGSRANHTGQDRVAVALSVLPPGSRFEQCYVGPGTPPEAVDVYEVDESYFYRDLAELTDGRRPQRHRLVGRAPRGDAPLTEAAAVRRLRDARAATA